MANYQIKLKSLLFQKIVTASPLVCRPYQILYLYIICFFFFSPELNRAEENNVSNFVILSKK